MVTKQTEIITRQYDGWQQLPADWPDCLRRILAARGIQSPQDLYYELAQLPRPTDLLGMDAAVALLYQALQQQWHVMVVADFDSDGATSCAVAIRGLKAMGLKHVDFIVPNRFIHGYGLTSSLLQDIPEQNQPDLLLTVDNGIASVEGVKAAQARGMKVLVTDHHLPGEVLPAADAIVNPNQPSDAFPSKNLAGVGVCFYLLLGLRQYLREQNWFNDQSISEPRLVDLLDLVALGTVADVVPLDRLNRTLVDMGIKRIRTGLACAAINGLMQIAGKDIKQISTTDLAFAVAPKLNAAGRMEDMGLGIETLLMDDPGQALAAAQTLDEINQQRRAVETSMQQDAQSMLAQLNISEQLNAAYCLYDANWHQGVIGLLASRVKEKLHRPVIVFAPGDNGELKGSARSIPGVHIRDVLARIDAEQPNLIDRFGGHAMAAGLSLSQNRLEEFEQQLQTTIEEFVDPAVFNQTLYSDGELRDDELQLQLAELLPQAAPWGQGFDEPRFHGVFKVSQFRSVGQDNDHLRLTIQLADNRQLTAMAFRQQPPEWLTAGGQALIRYRLDVNEYRATRSLQLLVDEILPA